MLIYCNFNYVKNVLNLERLYFIVQERYIIINSENEIEKTHFYRVKAKEPRTVETLKAYILNNLFGIESDQLQPRGVSREAIFIPMGWDTEKRINLLKEGPELPATIATPRQR